MKKLIASTVAFLFIAATILAQSNDVSLINTDSKTPGSDMKNTKKEKREERKELRKLNGGNVSFMSKENFYVDFGDLPNVTWQRTAYFDEARFKKDNIEMTAFYDDESKLVGTTSPKIFTDLPDDGQKFISKKYKDYTVEKVIFFDDNEFNDTDMYLYGTQYDDEDNYFVELKKGDRQIILHVDTLGNVSFFKQLN